MNVQGWCADEQMKFSVEGTATVSGQRVQMVSQPRCLDLPSPFHVLTEQKIVKCVKKNCLEIHVEIFVTPKVLPAESMRKELTEKGKCSTSISKCRRKSRADDKKMDKECTMRICTSPKGLYVSLTQSIANFQLNLNADEMEFPPMENTHPQMIPMKLTTSDGQKLSGDLRLNYSCKEHLAKESVSFGLTVNIGLKDVTNIGSPSTNVKKEAADAAKSCKLEMNVQFDEKKMSLFIAHNATVDVSEKTNASTGSIEVKEKIESAIKY